MKNNGKMTYSYFPGCSLATTAKENNRSLFSFCEEHGVSLIELKDWNCCGSSSAHSIDSELAHDLPARNLALAPADRPLLVACPSCYLRLKSTYMDIAADPEAQKEFGRMFGRKFNPDLQIVNFFEMLARVADTGAFEKSKESLKGLRFAPYYGCMLMRPPKMRRERTFSGLMEKVLSSLGAEPVQWAHKARCCGTFLSVSRPLVSAKSVQTIMTGAEKAGAECIVTACAMCHLNLEIRSRQSENIPVLHFSELLSLAGGIGEGRGWFRRHLIDPRPLLRSRRLIA
ncbi:MAG: CoB--CoM heterodisulfide reductase iron-sulfur subunit B family protein [Desulfobacterales bacterium]